MNRAFLFALALLLVQSIAFAASPKGVILNTAHYPPRSTPEGTGFEDLIVKEAFRRIGVELSIIHLPSERCLINVNEGIDDGNFARVEGMGKIYPHLLPVQEPIAEFEFAVFARGDDIRVNGWESLNSYHIGYVTGWKIVEAKTARAAQRTAAKDNETLFRLLESGRIDVAIFDRIEGEAFVRSSGIKGIVSLKPVLEYKSMYIYLHERHAAIAVELTKAIRDMKRDGTFTGIMTKVLH